MSRPPDEAIPCIATLEGLEDVSLEPEEAFVLSRVNGTSTLKEIGQILSYDTARVWKLLQRAVEAGVVVVRAQKEPPAKRRPPKTKSILEQLDDEDQDPSLSNIPRSFRSDVRLRHSNMVSQTHYEVLGVLAGASTDLIKRKYLELVKEFHPDRRFAQDLGHYRSKLEALFERMTLAHDELISPARREAYNRSVKGRKSGKQPAKKESKKREIKPPPADHLERLGAAKRYFKMGEKEEKAGNQIKAANFYQLAVQYDPKTEAFVEAWTRTRYHILQRKAEEAYSLAEDFLFRGDDIEGLRLLEEAHRLDPKKKECYRELAMIYLKKDRIPEAKKMVVQALEYFPSDARVHGARGLIYKEEGDKKAAIRELRIALRLDENLESLQKILSELEGSK